MGTDVHAVFQKKVAAKDGTTNWECVQTKWEQNRHYQLFAVLAGVRNGFGFAGVITGEAVTPISEPRGIPVDSGIGGDGCIATPWEDRWGDAYVWLGTHSHSWLTSTEMLAHYRTLPTVIKTGVITREEFLSWDGSTPPETYYGSVSGPGVVTIPQNRARFIESNLGEDYTHVQIKWSQGLKEELQYFFDEIQRLHDLHGEVRMVFGFDS